MEIIKRNTDYAFRALVFLASNPGAVVSASEIAAKGDVPFNFLQKILQKLVSKGLVKSHRGVQGGFSLAKDPSQVTLLEVIEAIQGKLAVNRCFFGKDSCPRAHKCRLKSRWLDIENKIIDVIQTYTLEDLVRDAHGHFPLK